MEVKKETAAKISLFGAVMIILGAMIGIGIFFKNDGVFRNNNGNAIGILISWILSSIIAFSTIFCFSEVVSAKTRIKNSGLAGWTESFCGYKTGRAVQLIQPIFYYGIYVITMGVFCGEAILNCFAPTPGTLAFGDLTMLYVVLIGLGISTIVITINCLSLRAGANVAKVTTVAKFLPLAMVVLFGFIFGGLNGGGLWVDPAINPDNTYSGEFSISGVFMSIPAIFFAFDSFLVVGNVYDNVNNPKKTVPLSIVISMIVVIVAYLLITFAQITIACGSPYQVVNAAFSDPGVRQAFNIVFSILMLIAVFGSNNSFCLTGIRSMQSLIDGKLVFGYQWFNKISNGKKTEVFGGTILLIIFSVFYTITLSIPSIIMNNDQILDGFSTIIVLFFFFIYGTTILMTLINRKTKKVQVDKIKGFTTFAGIAIVGCYFVFFYCAIYQFMIQPIVNPTGINANSFGLFIKYDRMLNWEVCLVFWMSIAWFFAIPFINDLLIKKFDKSYDKPLIWQKYKKAVNTL